MVYLKSGVYYSYDEVAEMANEKTNTLYQKIRLGKLKGEQIGCTWIVHSDDVNVYLSKYRLCN